MRARWISAFLCGCALQAASCAGPAHEPVSDEARAEVLTLAFAWPRDLRAEVEVKRTKIRQGLPRESQRVIEARYRLRTEPLPLALRIVSEDLRVTSVDGRALVGGASLAGIEAAEPTLTALAPTLRVDAEASVLEVEGIEDLRRETAERIAQGSPRAAAHAARIAEQAITPETIAEHWGYAVGNWVGMEVEVGAVYDLEDDAGRSGTLEVSEREACFPGDTARRCLRLLLRSSGEIDEFEEEVRAVGREFGAPEAPADTEVSVELREEVELLTEPERLVPHFVRARRERRLDVEVAGERRNGLQIEESEARYRY